MNAPSNYKSIRRRLCGIAALLGLLVSTARFAVARLEFIVISDVLRAGGIAATLLPLLQTLLILFGFALFYGFTAILIQEIGFKKALPFMFLTVGVMLYRAALALCGKVFFDGLSEYEFLTSALPLQLLSLAVELGQYLLILLVIWLTLKLTAKPPRATLAASLTVLLINLFSRIVYDVDYGMPTSSREVLQMVGAYTSDILLYGVLLFVAMRLFAKWGEKLANKNS